MNGTRFDAIFLDFYGTISSGDREAVEATCKSIVQDLGLPIRPHELAVKWGDLFFRTAEASNHDKFRTLYECEVVSLRETLADFGIKADEAVYVRELEDYWANPPVYADALEFLRWINLPTCVVSNADDSHILAAVERHRLKFSAVVTSESARCYKPDAKIFEKALVTMGVRPERVLHVGDSLHSDVGGAAQLGITTAWLNRASRIHDIGTATANHCISMLTDLKELIT